MTLRGSAPALVQNSIEEIPISDELIRLGQFLKLANLVDSGADAKAAIVAGEVKVDGSVELRRGRQLTAGNVVGHEGRFVRVVFAHRTISS